MRWQKLSFAKWRLKPAPRSTQTTVARKVAPRCALQHVSRSWRQESPIEFRQMGIGGIATVMERDKIEIGIEAWRSG